MQCSIFSWYPWTTKWVMCVLKWGLLLIFLMRCITTTAILLVFVGCHCRYWCGLIFLWSFCAWWWIGRISSTTLCHSYHSGSSSSMSQWLSGRASQLPQSTVCTSSTSCCSCFCSSSSSNICSRYIRSGCSIIIISVCCHLRHDGCLTPHYNHLVW